MRSVVNDVSSASNAARSSVQRKGRSAITLVSFSGRRRTPQITGALGCPAIRGPLIARPFTCWLDASSGGRQSFPHKHARHVSTRSESVVATTDLSESIVPVERNCPQNGIYRD